MFFAIVYCNLPFREIEIQFFLFFFWRGGGRRGALQSNIKKLTKTNLPGVYATIDCIDC